MKGQSQITHCQTAATHLKLRQLAQFVGITPLILLSRSDRKIRSLKFPKKDGIGPEWYWLSARERALNFVKLSRVEGMLPVKPFWERFSWNNCVRFPKLAGMLPEKLSRPGYNAVSDVKSPKLDGMILVKAFSPKYKIPYVSQFPKLDARIPIKLL